MTWASVEVPFEPVKFKPGKNGITPFFANFGTLGLKFVSSSEEVDSELENILSGDDEDDVDCTPPPGHKDSLRALHT